MQVDTKILIISLIFIVGLYILLYRMYGYYFANSFLAGGGLSLINLYALTRLARSMLGRGIGWLFVPLGIIRWVLFGLVIFVVLRYYKALPLPLLIGVCVPHLGATLLTSIYTIIWGNKDGAST